MKKQVSKVLSLLLSAILLLGIIPITAFAAEAVALSGTGTADDPWLIESAEDLIYLSDFVNTGKAGEYDADAAAGGSGVAGNFYGYYFKQTADIDMTGIAWEPIGYSGSYYFAGNYDGGNHTISNITSTGKEDADGYSTAGIFGWVAFGSVKNLNVDNANFSATGNYAYSYVGGLTGVTYGSSITNCSVKDSTIESKRTPRNNNCAGGISGYVTGGNFESCASERNTIIAQVYGGGFVGEIDDDYAGPSKFTNCYVAECSVTASSPNAQDTNVAGGFVGELTVGDFDATNCYVFDTVIAIGEESKGNPKRSGVLVGNLWANDSDMLDSNCYYGKCTGTTENTGSATSKMTVEFADGTVAALLGNAFADGENYPLIATLPADYSAVDAAIEKAEALNKDEFANFSEVEAAIEAVVYGKTGAEQDEVDAMAKAIEDAIYALKYKPETGNGIASIEKTGTQGLVDTYTITYTDGTTTTFTVTNGEKGEQGIQGIQGVAGENGHTPVITIQEGYWYIDGVNTNQPAQGIQGETGNGISDISKTKTEGLVDTYTITFTNGNTTTFTVTNGEKGDAGVSISGVNITDSGEIVISFDNGTTVTAGIILSQSVKFTIAPVENSVVNYGATLALTANVDLPAGAQVMWTASNSNFSYLVSEDSKTCSVKAAHIGETVFTAYVVNADGQIVSTASAVKLTAKLNFFQRILAFFKHFFGFFFSL